MLTFRHGFWLTSNEALNFRRWAVVKMVRGLFTRFPSPDAPIKASEDVDFVPFLVRNKPCWPCNPFKETSQWRI